MPNSSLKNWGRMSQIFQTIFKVYPKLSCPACDNYYLDSGIGKFGQNMRVVVETNYATSLIYYTYCTKCIFICQGLTSFHVGKITDIISTVFEFVVPLILVASTL